MPRKYIKKNSYRKYTDENFKSAIELVGKGCTVCEDLSLLFALITIISN